MPELDTSLKETALTAVRSELAGVDKQKNRLYELLELGEYDLPLFRERMAVVKEKRAALEQKERTLVLELQELKHANPAALAKQIGNVLDAYHTADAATRNSLLKSILKTIWYKKEKKTKPTEFQLKYEYIM